jgi:hypothetical protein
LLNGRDIVGYRTRMQTCPVMPFAYRDHTAWSVRVRTRWNSPCDYDMWEKFFRDDFDILRALPMSEGFSRELLMRYVWSRVFQRYQVYDNRLSEITMIDRKKWYFLIVNSFYSTQTIFLCV